MMVIFCALICCLFPGWLYQRSAPCSWRISQWMPMPVPLNLEVVSKRPHKCVQQLTAFNNARNCTVQMLDVSSTCCPERLPNTEKNKAYRLDVGLFLASLSVRDILHASVFSAVRAAQVQSCWWWCRAADVDTDTLLLIKPLINMSELLYCSLHC